jgi:hypothetical protein
MSTTALRAATAAALTFALAVTLSGCSHTVYQAKFTPVGQPAALDTTAPILKCHLADGSVYVLERWNVDVGTRIVRGSGLRYAAGRGTSTAAEAAPAAAARSPDDGFRIPLDDVVLFETNHPERLDHPEVATMTVITVASLALTTACALNPKACFGSCPTFYASDGTRDVLQAEGFSASAARVLEATDIDAMWTAHPTSHDFEVRMTNEALESHAVDHVRLLAAPRPPGTRVLRAGDAYFPSARMHEATACTSPLGSCLEASRASDGLEYLSPASEHDLAARETLDLTFPRGRGHVGLAVVARNSLLDTFVFYQLLAYMGRSAPEWFARVEQEGPGSVNLDAFKSLLGDIDVAVETRDGWRKVGAFSEVGPIAREVQLIPFPAELAGEEVHVRLTMTRGHWKIEQLALAELGAPVRPTTIDPHLVTRDGRADERALQRLLVPGAHLVTNPGDSYTLHYRLPDLESELFLDSRGYYYEWIRPEWLAEESSTEIWRSVLDPAGTLRRLAPKYKSLEGTMEETFWKSRFGGPRP